MRKLEVNDIEGKAFSTKSHYDGRIIGIVMTGNADTEVFGALQGLLSAVDGEALRLKVDEVALDWHELYFMTSSCLSLIVQWIDQVATRQPNYKIRFRSNPALRWQQKSLKALSRFGAQLVSVD